MRSSIATDSTSSLPVVDLAGLAGDDAAIDVIARELDEAFSQTGFCYFANTGIDPRLVAEMFEVSRRFHAQPESEKRALAMNEFHRGYMAPNTSKIVTSTVARVTRPNFSESFMLMHAVAPGEARFGQPMHGPNQWPAALPGFREIVTEYEAAMADLCRALLRPLARALSLADDWFLPYFERPTTFLRLLHYPPQAVDADAEEFGSAPHTDYGFITILAQDMAGGLEVRRRDGTWLAAMPVPGTFVVNVADMLARWTNGRWQSTPHRVKNVSGGDRYSCPYFFDMDMDATITCLPTCTDAANPPRHEAVRYGDYLLDRLNRNYTYRRPGSPTPDS